MVKRNQVMDLSSSDGTVAGTSSSTSIPKLNGRNFNAWRSMIEIVAKLRGLHTAIFEPEKSANENEQLRAKLTLLEAMDERHAEEFSEFESASEMIERLKLMYADKSASNVYRLIKSFYRYQYEQGDSMSTHINKMERMRRELKNLGQETTDEVYMVLLLDTLPPEYEVVVENWETVHPDVKTIANLNSRILKKEEDLKVKAKATESSFFTGNPSRPGKPGRQGKHMSIEERKKTSHCTKCGHKGHWYRECKTRPENYIKKNDDGQQPCDGKSKLEDKQSTEHNLKVVYNMGNLSYDLKNYWLADSGATSHMSNNKLWFIQLKEFNPPKECSVGNGDRIKIFGEGTVPLICHTNNGDVSVELNHVLFVPDLTTNLISLGRAADHGVTTTMDRDSCIMSLNEQVVSTGKRYRGSLYLMNIRATNASEHAIIATEQAAFICHGERTLSELHRIFGHVSKQRIQQLAKDPAMGIKITDPAAVIDCPDCPMGSGKHTSHPDSTRKKAEQPGEMIHIDLSGQHPTSASGARYFLLCKDEWTSYSYVYFLKSKESDRVNLALSQFVTDFEVDSTFKVRRIRSDCGSEFVNKATQLLFAAEHIVHEKTAPYTPQQNGAAEREIQSIVNMARTNIHAAKLPVALWQEAINTACYVKNRLPNSTTNITPYEKLFQRKPVIKNLCEFGREVHVIRNGHYLTKFESRTEPAHVVGFTKRQNTFRVYLKESERVLESSDVIFRPHSQNPKSSRSQEPSHGQDTVTMTFPESRNSGARSEHLSADYFNFDDCQTPDLGRAPARSTYATPARGDSIRYDDQSELDQTTTSQATDKDDTLQPEQQEPQVRGANDNNSSHEFSCDSDEPDEITVVNTAMAFITADLKEPASYEEAVTCGNRENWQIAIDEELEAHRKNVTWSIVERPRDKKLLSVKWIFKVKCHPSGTIERYKARLVVRGFEQQAGRDYFETFAPVARYESMRIMVALAAHYNLQITQFDVKTAFLYGDIDEVVYIQAPQGIKLKPNQALRLNKGLYGLKQAPRLWNNKFNKVVQSQGFQPTLSDPCLFYHTEKKIFLSIYVDDGLLLAKDQHDIEQVIGLLQKQFDIRIVKNSTFVGSEITKTQTGYFMHQTSYTRALLKRFKMSDCSPVSSPLMTSHKLTHLDNKEPPAICNYREAIGALLYLATNSRPDILHAITLLARFCEHPKEKHWIAIKRVMRYLRGTLDYGLTFQRGNKLNIVAYTDADWAGDNATRKSVSGAIIFLAGGPIIFRSIQQSLTALSTTEAEFIASTEAVKELAWTRTLLNELNIPFERAVLRCDSETAIRLIKNPELHRRTKHVDIKFHFIRDWYSRGMFELEHVPGGVQLADYLTKALPRERHGDLIRMSNITRQPKTA